MVQTQLGQQKDAPLNTWRKNKTTCFLKCFYIFSIFFSKQLISCFSQISSFQHPVVKLGPSHQYTPGLCHLSSDFFHGQNKDQLTGLLETKHFTVDLILTWYWFLGEVELTFCFWRFCCSFSESAPRFQMKCHPLRPCPWPATLRRCPDAAGSNELTVYIYPLKAHRLSKRSSNSEKKKQHKTKLLCLSQKLVFFFFLSLYTIYSLMIYVCWNMPALQFVWQSYI